MKYNNNNFTVNKYLNLVNAITNLHFDEQGDYAPWQGRIAAMCLFYNVNVPEDKQITDLAKADAFCGDKKFLKAFNRAINSKAIRLDFGNAYRDAIAKIKESLSTTAYIRRMTAELTQPKPQPTATGGDA